MAVDDEYTKSLLHFNGSDASTTFTDETGKTWIPAGNAQIVTAEKKFGTAAGLFDGTGDYLTCPSHADFAIGSGDDFTIDFWVYANSFSKTNTMLLELSNYYYNNGITLQQSNSAHLKVFVNSVQKLDLVHTIAIGSWAHIALVRESGTLYLYEGGTSLGSAADSSAISADDFTIAADNYNSHTETLDGFIDEFRFSNGIARWTANFTPPTSEYSKSSDESITESLAVSDETSIQTIIALSVSESLDISDITSNTETDAIPVSTVSTITAEDARWYKEKRPLVNEYLKNTKQVESIVSGRGHLYRPGFLSGMITDVEQSLKFKLSDLNYDIVKEAIERELTQTGFDYDIAYKEASIAWQLEKTQLMSALEQEFADNKYLRELDEQELDRLEIQINLRKLIIFAAKTAIDEDMETERQTLTRVDRSTFSAEDALLKAKLLTAQKKLEVIPYIEIVLEKQQEIIDAETNNADRKEALITEKENLNEKRVELITAKEAIADAIVELIAAKKALVLKRESLIDAKELVADQEIINVGYLDSYISSLTGLNEVQQDLVAAKKDLIPKLNEKSTALIAYAAELDAWVIVKNVIATVKEEIAEYMETRADRKGDIIDAKVDLNDLKLDLQEANINLEIARMTGRSDLLAQQTSNLPIWLEERESAFDSKLTRDAELVDKTIDVDAYESQKRIEGEDESNDIEFDAEVRYMSRESVVWNWKEMQIAEMTADARVTSELIHLLA